VNTCPVCGAGLRPGARFCQKCGTPLPSGISQAAVSTNVCPHCGAVLRAGAQFCQNCGQVLTAVRVCPDCGALLRPGARFCAKCGRIQSAIPAQGMACLYCGAPLRAGARFCAKCGHELRVDPLTTPAPFYISSPQAPTFTPPPPTRSKPTYKPTYNTGELLPTQVIAERYVIVEKIAQGGMGAIYKAQDKRLQGKEVALKEMSETAIAPDEKKKILGSFMQEARLLANLNHVNLARVTDQFQEDERHYMVMEFIEGKTLEWMLDQQQSGFPEERVLLWAGQLCDVLSYLHNQTPPIIYRDIKPANIMVVTDTDDIKLIDFGIARFFKLGQSKDTIQFGTEGYAPPEQWGKAQTDARADVYALGATLHELLTCYDPATQLFSFPPVRQLNPSVSKRVESALAKAVEPNKEKRHQSMAEMWEALSGEKPHWFHLSAAEPKARIPLKAATPSSAPDQASPQAIVIAAPQVGTSIAPVVQFRKVITSETCPRRHEIEVPPGDETKLSTSVQWVQVTPDTVDDTGGTVTVSLVNTRDLKPGKLQIRGGRFRNWLGWHTSRLVPVEKEYQSYIIAKRQNGPETQIPVSVTVSPPGWQVAVGWGFTLAAMLMELGIPLYLILALLAG